MLCSPKCEAVFTGTFCGLLCCPDVTSVCTHPDVGAEGCCPSLAPGWHLGTIRNRTAPKLNWLPRAPSVAKKIKIHHYKVGLVGVMVMS